MVMLLTSPKKVEVAILTSIDIRAKRKSRDFDLRHPSLALLKQPASISAIHTSETLKSSRFIRSPTVEIGSGLLRPEINIFARLVARAAMDETPIFRAPKRRKLARPQRDSPPAEPSQIAPESAEIIAKHAEQQNQQGAQMDETDISNVIRARKHARRPITGVQFSTTTAARQSADDAVAPSMDPESNAEKQIDISNRFVGSTGQVVNVDRHMFVGSAFSFVVSISSMLTR
jgi:hypothetical protein